ncbi:MAG: ABC-type transporter, periplasmic subunit [Ilumatobacteraceae bacterium]|nr:ABC-type transporter, periplasmic subunit [Ilumatobacteraceae bacterium]
MRRQPGATAPSSAVTGTPRTRREACRLAFAAVTSIVVAACGSGKSNSASPAAPSGSTGAGSAATGSTAAGAAAKAADADGSGGTLIVGMTATNFPGLDTVRGSSEGGEGTRFVTFQLYDGLTKWDLTHEDIAPKIIPGLAESWEVSADQLVWTFHLRSGVTFHDGTPWNADAAIYNFDRLINKASPLYNAELAGLAAFSTSGLKSAEKVDDMTITVHTNGPWGFLDEDLVGVPMGSPTAIAAAGGDMSDHPIGTGPFKFESVTRGQQLVFVKNENYFLGPPKLDKLILRPLPEVTSRMAALRAGEVNWIEVPSPDEAPALKSEGFQVKTNSYPHNWPWQLNMKKAPFDKLEVRQAVNYAINRDALAADLLQGTAEPAYAYLGPGDPAWTPDLSYYTYDPDKAKQLLTEAGFPDGFTATVSISTSGSGQMLPVPMNELLQRDLAKVGIKIELQPIEWASMLTDFFATKFPGDANAMNVSLGMSQAAVWGLTFSTKGSFNVSGLSDPQVDALVEDIQKTFTVEGRNDIYRKLNARLLEVAPWMVIVHDLNPRSMAANVHGIVMARSWSVDLTQVWVGK